MRIKNFQEFILNESTASLVASGLARAEREAFLKARPEMGSTSTTANTYVTSTTSSPSTISSPLGIDSLKGQNGRLDVNKLVVVDDKRNLRLAPEAAKSYLRMVEDAKKQGVTIKISDAYRSLGSEGDSRRGVWSQWSAWERWKRNPKYAARPGTSNHGLGAAIDVEGSAAQNWILRNGANYGWYNYPAEKWHFDYKPQKSSGNVVTNKNSQSTGTLSGKESIGSYGKFTPASSKSSPLVVVYGGIPVGGRESGDYMYDYFKTTGSKYNLFVANSHKVNGPASYTSIEQKLKSGNINPSKKILYLFSGGYRPGKDLLDKVGAQEFDKIFLVDIWMGSGSVSSFYKDLVAKNPGKVEYYYTTYGGNDSKATSYIASKSSKSFKNAKNNHMLTNVDAVSSLMNQF